MTQNFKITRFACYSAYFTMSSIFCLPPLLFVTFHEMYNVSWTLLGTLVLVNFCTQLVIDLVFSAFSKKFNVNVLIKVMPLITSLGLVIYAVWPYYFPSHTYLGLLIGTFIFSLASGLSEVLLSPTIAAMPSKNPQRDMSLLHSLYGFGVLSVVIVGTLFIRFFGAENWMYLTLFFAALPIISAVLFFISPMPNILGEEATKPTIKTKERSIGLALCFGSIFFGSCAEVAMSNWISSYMEEVLNLDKTVGDILGMALFAVLLAVTRICYAKWGKNIVKTLFLGMLGAAVCYLTVGLSSSTVLSVEACILSGIFTSMLWPGTLIMMEEKISGVGVASFALMAAGGDLGASVSPQLLGIIADTVSLKAGMLVCSVFPILGVILLLIIIKFFKRKEEL